MAGPVLKRSNFLEQLPQAQGDPCPPVKALQKAYGSLWRYVSNNPPTVADFASHAAQGKTMPKVGDITPCRWASCSLFIANNVTYQRLPKPRKRFKYIARLSITPQCGMSDEKGIHLDFWPFSGFAPKVLEVVEL
jgi:hypothetical protein